MRSNPGSAEGVAVLVRMFPFKIDNFAVKCLAETPLNLDDFARARFSVVVVPEVGEVSPAAARGIWGIDHAPALVAVPNPHGANGAHARNVSISPINQRASAACHAQRRASTQASNHAASGPPGSVAFPAPIPLFREMLGERGGDLDETSPRGG